jgi:Spy/CpxP family protein refolding chaperone
MASPLNTHVERPSNNASYPLTYYPAPETALALKYQLMMSKAQIANSETLIKERAEFVDPLQSELDRKQAALSHLFKAQQINDDTLALLLTEISILETKIDYLTLGYRIKQHKDLTPQQRDQYAAWFTQQ